MGLSNLFSGLAKNFLTGGTVASQPSAIIERTGGGASPAEALKQVNTSIDEANPQGELTTLPRPVLEQLSTAGTTATAPLVATTAPAEISSSRTDLATNNLAEATPAAAVKLEFSEAAVESLRPILSTLTDLFNSILPGLNLQKLAATAKECRDIYRDGKIS
jgi:hypothetical protein